MGHIITITIIININTKQNKFQKKKNKVEIRELTFIIYYFILSVKVFGRLSKNKAIVILKIVNTLRHFINIEVFNFFSLIYF